MARLRSTQYGEESRYEKYLRRLNIPCCIPREQVYRRRGAIREYVLRPVFGGYVFLAVESVEQLADVRAADRASHRRVSQWIEIRDQRRFRQELDDLSRVLAADPTLSRLSGLCPGDEVLIVAGPLKGVRGRIDRVHRNILHISVSILGQTRPVEIDAEAVEAA
ncbi:MAG TPA: transcription termination/antitermination NusG family protein [Tepidisphaeraceae bacterium]|nr:transcription termination/antitermination NusG family protein [Tepidisphaeraceae bacterium]